MLSAAEIKNIKFSKEAQNEIKVATQALNEILEITRVSFTSGNLEVAKKVEPLEQVIDRVIRKMRARHIDRLSQGKCTIELGFILSDIITNFERVSDHCSNIAVCLLEVSEDEFDTHAYLDELKKEDNIDFKGKVMTYRERYQLPQ